MNVRRQRTLRIGLTGPIGCGKSTIATALANRGGVVIDADALTREATAPGTPALAAIGARFGASVIRPDGSLERAALAGIVFADPAALRDLEAITHPAVRPLMERQVAAAEDSGAPFVVVEAIKLVESGLAERCDEVWLVICAPEQQRARLAERGYPPYDGERRMATQSAGLIDRLRPHATRVIDASGAEDATVARAVEALGDALEKHGAGRSRS